VTNLTLSKNNFVNVKPSFDAIKKARNYFRDGLVGSRQEMFDAQLSHMGRDTNDTKRRKLSGCELKPQIACDESQRIGGNPIPAGPKPPQIANA
jgi:hypothetical protein